MHSDDSHDIIWTQRYGYVCPPEQGKIVTIEGIGNRDCYNPCMCQFAGDRLLAFRLETRQSSIYHPDQYHPSVAFARCDEAGTWHLADSPAPFDMLEDPTRLIYTVDGQERILFGGVRVGLTEHRLDIETDLYDGTSLHDLNREEPFAIIKGMKDVRLLQLPDGRFLLCRRPKGEAFGEGRITLHLLDKLETLRDLDHALLPTIAILDSGFSTDWVGTNNAYLLQDTDGMVWVGLLSHLALRDINDGRHYAVTTYKISLKDLLDSKVHSMMPNVIATRTCFEDGPEKTHGLQDVVFPGSLEPLGGERYRLWAGLSDARIGCVVVDDPFHLRASTPARRESVAA